MWIIDDLVRSQSGGAGRFYPQGIITMFWRKNPVMPSPEEALPGRSLPLATAQTHYVNGNSLHEPYLDVMQKALFGLGCFWGAEKAFWSLPGVYITAVGYSAGYTPNPTYEEVCSGRTGHNEVVLVVFDPAVISYEQLVKHFFENHDPTQIMQQGNDVGTQYRSGLYVMHDEQHQQATLIWDNYQAALNAKGYGRIATEIVNAGPFYFAEEYHQQYLAKNPGGYCGLGGTGISCPVGL
jgi:peptide-methionine (S)-S-oxide reductase